ncbi:hypothetical protein AX14_013916 [Amanita brunnescens Koide BX004]|nr:hypothetical protein AX14_013916 [Amanita brunnescens Koide BX004]
MQQPRQNYAKSPEFLPIKNGQRVASYRDSLSLVYIYPNTAHLPRNRWTLFEIKTYKDKGTKVKHEYLIATFHDGGHGVVSLRIERRIQEYSAKGSAKVIASRSRGERNPRADRDLATEDVAQPNAKPAKNAVDEVCLVSPNFNNQLLVEHMVFDNKTNKRHMSLPKLIVLACAVNALAEDYHLLEKNCYWFCYIIGKALTRLSTPSFPPIARRGQQGTWLGLPTDALWTDVKCEVLLEKYNTMWGEFKQKIKETINHPNNEFLKGARQRVDEEVGLRQESEKRVEKEKRRSEQLERELAEVKAQLARAKVRDLTNILYQHWVNAPNKATYKPRDVRLMFSTYGSSTSAYIICKVLYCDMV